MLVRRHCGVNGWKISLKIGDFNDLVKYCLVGVSKITQWAKYILCMPYDLSWNSQTHLNMEEEKWLQKLLFDPDICNMAYVHTHTKHTYKQ